MIKGKAGLAQIGQGSVDAAMEHGDHFKDDTVHVDDAATHLILGGGLVAADLVSPPGSLMVVRGRV